MQTHTQGGVWINFGPLNYQPTLKLKLVWEEMRALWEHLGYDFVQESRVSVCVCVCVCVYDMICTALCSRAG